MVCPVEQRDDRLREALLVRCRTLRIEPPGRAERIIGAAKTASEAGFCRQIQARLGAECVGRLEALVDGERAQGLLAQLKADPGRIGSKTLLREVDKLAVLRRLGLPAGLFAGVSDKLVSVWRVRAARSYPSR